MNLKKLIAKEAGKVILKETTTKLLPMDEPKPRLGKKAKLAGVLAAVAAVLSAASQFLGG